MMEIRHNQGFTLIEFMVALTISLLSLLAVSELYLNSRQSARLQQMQNVLTEEGRFAISMLQRTVAQAGFRPVTAAMPVSVMTANSDRSLSVMFTQDGNQMRDCAGNAAVGNQTLTIATVNSALRCTPAVGNAVDWIAAPDASGQGVELVDFRLSYGVDTGPATDPSLGCGDDLGNGNLRGDCVVDVYQVPAVGSALQRNIRSVRACLVLRTNMTDPSVLKSGAVIDCAGAAIANSQNDRRLYRLLRTTIQLKNR